MRKVKNYLYKHKLLIILVNNYIVILLNHDILKFYDPKDTDLFLGKRTLFMA
ncbi:hypothetical protein THMIRHAT_23630 [Thiosulfativibrio zosterae]|uniref:Uncharacterized protein n=1 Tax=Thiosulfativibrio zosterae TaxID=2675053 RepID=A0A6F8PRF8_9GAMM|nr:hypothetical protein THMIRHAT_23630 [Thiosulfativibrio zosterae]